MRDVYIPLFCEVLFDEVNYSKRHLKS